MQEVEWLTETGAQFEALELGRAGNMTSQTIGKERLFEQCISIHNNPPLTFTPKAFQRFADSTTYYESKGEKEKV